MTYNKIYAVIGEERHITLDPINYQYDVKQILVLTGETVPDYYEADVCNVGDTATLTMVGTAADGVEIPDKFLQDGRNVLVYVVIPGSGGDVQTRYDITIPVDERAEREDIDPSEAEQQQIDSLINALNSGVERAEAAATEAAEYATDAEGSAGEAEDQAENAEAWAVGKRAGTDVGTEDPTYHNNSKYYAGRAEKAAEEAGQHEASWETWVRRAESAADDAEGSARAAAGSKAAAETAAQEASQKAAEAGNSAAAAAGSAASARQTVDGAIGAINTAKEGALTAIGQAGTTQVNAVNQAGAAQVTAVNQAGTTQVQAVEDKGNEVLDSIPQDYSDLVDDVDDLSRQLNDVEENQIPELKSAFDVETTEPSINLLDASQIETGCYYWTDGRHDSNAYNSTPMIAVTPGDTLYLQTGYENVTSRSNKTMRFVTGYDGNKAVIPSATQASVISYTVPEGVYYIIASVAINLLDASQFPVLLVSDTGTVLDYIPYSSGGKTLILKAESNNDTHIREIVEQVVNEGNAIFAKSAATLAANTNLICCDSCDNKKNEYIELTANFTSFGELTIAHGKGSYMGMYITITSDKIQIYNYNGTLIEEYDHGLTLSDFINVIIYTKNDDSCRSKISIMSAGGDYAVETSRYYSCRAAVLCNATFAMTNVEMRYTVNDAKADVWAFGDSYISLGDPQKWATQMVSSGHKNVLLCGFGGAMSANEIISFRALMAVARPKFVVWALGMNDGDSSTAANANWKTYVDEVIATCEEKNVTPILATIPNVPNVINTFKNAYVKSLDYRYVDFAKAVDAESTGATWYTGMLSSDNTHPTALGAKALMRQFLLDVPEVLYAEE